jgi:hypothetical protein
VVILATLLAQWTNPLTGNSFNNPISSSLDTYLYNKMQQRTFDQSMAARRGQPQQQQRPGTPAAPVAPVVHKSLVASDFTPVAKGHPVVDAYLSSPAVNDQTRPAMRALFDGTFAELAKARKNNVATAMASALAMAMGILSGQPLSQAATQELVLGVNDLLAASPDFARLKPQDRQAMYDSLAMTAALLAVMQEVGRNNPQMKAQSVVAARGVLQQLTGSTGPN